MILVGNRRNLKIACRNEDGGLFDPAELAVKISAPTATSRRAITQYVYGEDEELVKDGTGLYHVSVLFDRAGDWYMQAVTTAEGEEAKEQYLVAVGKGNV